MVLCLNKQLTLIMKKLKIISRHAESPNTIYSKQNQGNIIASQRQKSDSQRVIKRYDPAHTMDLNKQSLLMNKYRIVTEPIEDHKIQLSKSFVKMSKSKKRSVKMQTQHSSIKTRQKTNSNEKYQQLTHRICPNCQYLQRQFSKCKEQIIDLLNLKKKWKNGQIITDDFQSTSRRSISTLSIFSEVLISIQGSIVDLMKDIDVITEIDYPKLLASQIFNSEENFGVFEEEDEIKLLLGQLRDQIQGKISFWDMELQNGSDNFKAIFRNLKTNLMHCIRENLQLKTYHNLPKKKEEILFQDIKKAVMQILRGLNR